MIRHGLKNSVFITILMITYFILMKIMGLADNVWLRALNGLILFSGIYMAIRQWKIKNKGRLLYFHGIAVGMTTAAFTALIFGGFLYGYLSYDTQLMSEIASLPIFRLEFTPMKAALIIFFEALFSGYLFSYTSMQILKPSHVHEISN